MTQNFERIKKKYKIQALIAAAALSAFCGVAVACALLLAFKLSAIEILWVYYLLIGLGTAALSYYPFYLLLRPGDKKLAKKLDGSFGLNQKVQTMVEYSGESGAMAVLQREQADEALAPVVAKRPSARSLLKYAFIPVLAAGIALAGALVPARKTTVYVPPFSLTASQEAALNNLINDVEGSDLTETVRSYSAESLRTLLSNLKETDTQSEMKRLVIATVRGIDTVIANSNSYVFIYNQFKLDEYTMPFANAAAGGVTYYKVNPVSEISTMDAVARKYSTCVDEIEWAMADWVEDFVKTFNKETETENAPEELMTVPEMKTLAGNYSQAFASGLEKVAFHDAEDALCAAIAEFAVNIDVKVISGMGAENFKSEIESVCNKFAAYGCADALCVQSYACIMDEYIRNELARIFGLSVSDFGSNASVAPDIDDTQNGGDDDPSNSGGDGKGDLIYGGNDTVLDPDSGELVKYSDLLTDYENKIQERIREYRAIVSDEDATAEEKEEAKFVLNELNSYIDRYIGLLYYDSQDK